MSTPWAREAALPPARATPVSSNINTRVIFFPTKIPLSLKLAISAAPTQANGM
jgi:hypothetical protein